MRHCPTEKMIADFHTKPLQGGQLKVLRDTIMGHAPLPSEERVEVRSGRADGVRCDESVDITKDRKRTREDSESGLAGFECTKDRELGRAQGASEFSYADMASKNSSPGSCKNKEMETVLIKTNNILR